MKIKDKIQSFSLSDLGKSSLIVFALKLIGVLIFFLLSIFLTNYFPSEMVGRYDFARSLLLIIGGLNLLGFEQSIIYYSGKLRAENKFSALLSIYIKMIKAIFIVFSLLLLIALVSPSSFINNLFDKDLYDVVVKVVIAMFFHSLLMLNIEFLRANQMLITSESIRNIGRYLGFFVLAIIILLNDNYKWLAEVFLLNYVVLGILTTIYVYFKFIKSKRLISSKEFNTKNIVLASYPMALSTMTFFLLQNTDVILLSKYVSYSEVAYYSVAVKVAMLASVVMMAISTVIAPKVSEMYALKKVDELKSMMRKSALFIFGISVPIFILLLVGGSFILKIFGEEYTLALNSLYILVIGQLANAFSGPTGTYLNMTGRQKVLQFILIGAFVLNIALNLILIPLHGIEGAAIATASTTIIWNGIAVIYVYKQDKVKIFLH